MWAKLGAALGSSMEQACAQSYLVSPHGTSCPVKLQRHGVAEGRLNSGDGGTAGSIYYLCLRHLMTPIFRHRNSWIQFGIVFHTLNSDSSLHVLELSSTSSFKRESCLFKHKRASKDQCLAMVSPEKSYWFHQHLHCFLRAHRGRSWRLLVVDIRSIWAGKKKAALDSWRIYKNTWKITESLCFRCLRYTVVNAWS